MSEQGEIMPLSIFQRRLEELMESQGVKQSPLADAIGVTQSDVSRYLKGRIPSADIVYRLACHFGVSMDYFFGGQQEPKGWDPGEPMPKDPTLEELYAIWQFFTTNARAMKNAAQSNPSLSFLNARVASVSLLADDIREDLERRVKAAAEQKTDPPHESVNKVRPSKPKNEGTSRRTSSDKDGGMSENEKRLLAERVAIAAGQDPGASRRSSSGSAGQTGNALRASPPTLRGSSPESRALKPVQDVRGNPKTSA